MKVCHARNVPLALRGPFEDYILVFLITNNQLYFELIADTLF